MQTRFRERKYHSSFVFAALLAFGLLGGVLVGGWLSHEGTASLSPLLSCNDARCRFGTGQCENSQEDWDCDMSENGCEHDMCEAPE